jgi:hypothetical protein
MAGTGRAHRLQQRERPAEVVAPVKTRLSDGLRDQRLGRKVEHRVNAVRQHPPRHAAHVTTHQAGTGGHRVGMARR